MVHKDPRTNRFTSCHSLHVSNINCIPIACVLSVWKIKSNMKTWAQFYNTLQKQVYFPENIGQRRGKKLKLLSGSLIKERSKWKGGKLIKTKPLQTTWLQTLWNEHIPGLKIQVVSKAFVLDFCFYVLKKCKSFL